MFETNEASKIFNPLIDQKNPEYLWTHVSLRLHIPWFYIIYEIKCGDDCLSNILFISSIDDLISINNDKEIQVKQTYLVSPGHINSSEQWMMEPLKKVLSGVDPDHDQLSYIFVLENKNRYVYSCLGSKAEELSHIKTIYTSQ